MYPPAVGFHREGGREGGRRRRLTWTYTITRPDRLEINTHTQAQAHAHTKGVWYHARIQMKLSPLDLHIAILILSKKDEFRLLPPLNGRRATTLVTTAPSYTCVTWAEKKKLTFTPTATSLMLKWQKKMGKFYFPVSFNNEDVLWENKHAVLFIWWCLKGSNRIMMIWKYKPTCLL